MARPSPLQYLSLKTGVPNANTSKWRKQEEHFVKEPAKELTSSLMKKARRTGWFQKKEMELCRMFQH